MWFANSGSLMRGYLSIEMKENILAQFELGNIHIDSFEVFYSTMEFPYKMHLRVQNLNFEPLGIFSFCEFFLVFYGLIKMKKSSKELKLNQM